MAFEVVGTTMLLLPVPGRFFSGALVLLGGFLGGGRGDSLPGIVRNEEEKANQSSTNEWNQSTRTKWLVGLLDSARVVAALMVEEEDSMYCQRPPSPPQEGKKRVVETQAAAGRLFDACMSRLPT
jgi:hypothetical protein